MTMNVSMESQCSGRTIIDLCQPTLNHKNITDYLLVYVLTWCDTVYLALKRPPPWRYWWADITSSNSVNRSRWRQAGIWGNYIRCCLLWIQRWRIYDYTSLPECGSLKWHNRRSPLLRNVLPLFNTYIVLSTKSWYGSQPFSQTLGSSTLSRLGRMQEKIAQHCIQSHFQLVSLLHRSPFCTWSSVDALQPAHVLLGCAGPWQRWIRLLQRTGQH